ncbi:hypothetical protein KSP39_PZI007774 [Platanthera zijinensis]|uniref:Uncharacterized protein n=1 Tax=Platanthera zijinensis TaxID=2320716 RepID=A0AAP0G8P3_9ASPA
MRCSPPRLSLSLDSCRRSSTTTKTPLLRGESEDVILHRCRRELHRHGKLTRLGVYDVDFGFVMPEKTQFFMIK